MNRLELGVEYTTLDGNKFRVIRIDTGPELEARKTASCSDAYHRYVFGKWAGLWCGQEMNKEYRHHTDWSKVVYPQPEPTQLELF